MCSECAYQVFETSVKAGGASSVPALLAAGATSVGARGLGHWLAARGFGWVTPRRVTVATTLLVTVTMVLVVLGSAQRVLY